jgi:hypothetical protein
MNRARDPGQKEGIAPAKKRSQKTEQRQFFPSAHGCQVLCPHDTTELEFLPTGGKHYAKLRCADCHAFLKFVPDPKNIERRRLNGYRLAKLQMCNGLDSWERAFVDSLAKWGTKFSPRQQAVFDRICDTYLGIGGEK